LNSIEFLFCFDIQVKWNIYERKPWDFTSNISSIRKCRLDNTQEFYTT